MSKTKYHHAAALAVATALQAALEPFCQRIIIAGSLRRNKPEVGDIELLFVPRMEDRQTDFFSQEPVDLAAMQIQHMLTLGEISQRPNVNGHYTWGPQNKLAVHVASGIPVDFFSTILERWWVSLVIRTGSKDTNLRLTTGAMKQQRMLQAYGEGVVEQGGHVLKCLSEEDVFRYCNVPYLPAHERTY